MDAGDLGGYVGIAVYAMDCVAPGLVQGRLGDVLRVFPQAIIYGLIDRPWSTAFTLIAPHWA